VGCNTTGQNADLKGMKKIFKVGDKKEHRKAVAKEDFASFHGEVVHSVCSTFTLAREFEWTTRQFVLDMQDENEEGVGTFVNVIHHAPAFEGDEILYEGIIDEINDHEIICSVNAYVGEKLIASGKTGQKFFTREKIKKIFQRP
jgi:predicted thioesterase